MCSTAAAAVQSHHMQLIHMTSFRLVRLALSNLELKAVLQSPCILLHKTHTFLPIQHTFPHNLIQHVSLLCFQTA